MTQRAVAPRAKDQTDTSVECASCGHAQRFHAGQPGASAAATAGDAICTSPEDGTPCPCQGFVRSS
jgi:hypothetical protein